MNEILAGLTLGLHLVSAHVPHIEGQNNANLGAYVRHESGLSVGVYRNTLSRTSVWAGYTLEGRYFDLTVGVVSGYKLKETPAHCDRAWSKYDDVQPTCWPATSEGFAKHRYTLMAAPSIRLPEVGGLTPRVTYLPQIGRARSSVFHLSVEKTF